VDGDDVEGIGSAWLLVSRHQVVPELGFQSEGLPFMFDLPALFPVGRGGLNRFALVL